MPVAPPRNSCKRVALDIASGLHCDDGTASPATFNADITYTYGAYKPCHFTDEGAAHSGTVHCLDIGLLT